VILFRAIALAVVAVLLIEAMMVELEKAAPIVAQWGALWFALLFFVVGFVLRRLASIGSALFSAFIAAIAYVTLGHWILGLLASGVAAWIWLGPPGVIVVATVYFFALIAIGVGAASVRLPRRTQ
jgi:hypothetical protein